MDVISFQDYEVQFVEDTKAISQWIAQKSYTQIFVLVDENTKRDCLPLIAFDKDIILIEIKSGEKYKTLDTCQFIWQKLLSNNADRHSLLVNLGGGVIGDMGGFCASTYKRGIDFVNIPTTLLSMVDATIGGKTGIDFQGQKNMVGLFTFPKAIWVFQDFLKTLPTRQIKSGKAEMLKHALIVDENYWEDLQEDKITKEQILKSVVIKKAIVLTDVYEQGERKKLNFGHTIGHAIESYSLENDMNPLLHGEAICLGMIVELALSHLLLDFPLEKMEKIQTQIKTNIADLDFRMDKVNLDDVMSFLENDKKNSGGQIKMALLKDVGECQVDIQVDKTMIKRVLENF